ncbi:glycoside-pentoside-hexuronide (GPH):cation symporter [Georgenia sp. SYP-B2076]|uniref:glycoside-pentoside-hexuronide (GPH):cation symporter n=1 Tax=Georgenia sp. SYP-B2076 TaxID=2495881 RepID=UPI000F8E7D71|nr:glycoside-pentoside-hexuronide (GPH):cation symporter [Georgenia sp. SYP-B2076]
MTEATTTRTRVVPEKLTWKNYSGYAAGDAANNLAFSMASSFLLLYYTNVVAIEAAAIGTMFLVIRFWDAIADLFAGRMVDAKKPGRLGKFRPFILWFSLPLLLSSMAIFSAKTFFPDITPGQAIVYAYISYAVMGTLYSLVNIPYGSIAPAMTQVPTERAALASWRVWGSNITILMLSFVVAPQIKRFDGDPEGLQRSLTITTAIFVVVGMALYLYTIANVREQVQRDVAAPSMRESFGTLLHNKPLLWLCVGSLLFLTGLTAIGTLGPYYAIYVLKDPQYIAWNAVAQAAGTFLVASFIPTIVRRFGKRNGYIGLGLVGVVAGTGLAFAPPSTPVLAVVSFFLLGIGMGGVNTLMWALEADTVEYGEWKTGIRTEGTTYALFSFTRKMGQAIGGAAGAYTLGIVAFSSQLAAEGTPQAAETITGIQRAAGVVTAGFILLSLVVMFFYPLTDKVFKQVVSEITARRIQREAGEDRAAAAQG